MPYENSAGLGVMNHYGPRGTGKTAGVVKTEGASNEVSVQVDLAVLANGGPVITDVTIPAGSIIEEVYAQVTEAFTLTGTTPTLGIGTDGSEITNGARLSEAQAEATGTYNITSTKAGTWSTALVADTVVGVALGGTTPAATGTAGKVRFVVRYTQVSK